MLIRDYMTPYPKTLALRDTLKDAAQLFFKYRINGAPIVNDANEVCGLFTNAHLVEAIINNTPFQLPVSELMTKNVITVTPENTLEEAWQIPVSRLPVVSSENKLVGILTRRDFLAAFYTQMRQADDEVKALIRSAHNGIVVINSFGVITTFNDAAARLTGFAVQDALNKYVSDIIPHTGLVRVLHTGKSETNCQISVNGQQLFSNRSPICEGPKVVGALAILQDKSDLTHIAQELTDTQHHVEALENIFESAKQGIIVVDKNGIITKINQSYEEIFGVSREELIGLAAVDVIEDTRLHIILKTGVAELGTIQKHKGRQIIVNRLPIFKNGEIIGAIGEALFKNIHEINTLLERLRNLETQVSRYELALKGTRTPEHTFDDIIGRSRAIVYAKNLAAKAALTDSNVLILGESGTGKELFAQAIHNVSDRREKPFIAINCAAIPTELLEAELFGYEEGAFTGAKKGGKKGKFELANQGTIFLDEIGDMPLAMQAKMLRALQDRQIEHVGGAEPLATDIRIIAATNKPLQQMVREHTFREDLYYRLNVISIAVPPLRDRRDDIGELAHHLLYKLCKKSQMPLKQFSPETIGILRGYAWPGNVRELINLLEHLIATVGCQVISPRHLPAMHHPRKESENECAKIVETLSCAKGNKALAAKLLGIHRSTLYEKLKKYGLD